MFTLAESPDLSLARAEVALWLDSGTAQPPAPAFNRAHVEVAVPEEKLLEDFLARVALSGFELEIFPQKHLGTCRYRGYWTLRQKTVMGFHSASEAENEADARLLACAWLLRDEWSRRWLS
jgi:hypothetical protein